MYNLQCNFLSIFSCLYFHPQTEALRELKRCNPDGRYWIKADGTDVKPALQESLRREWNGDVDLQDGKLEEQRLTYDKRCSAGDKWKRSPAIERDELVVSLTSQLDELESDCQFLAQGLQNAVETFQVKMNSPSTPLETLKSLNWDIFEYQTLLEQASVFHHNVEVFLGDLDPVHARPVAPILHSVKKEGGAYLQYLRNLFKKKRVCYPCLGIYDC